MMVSTKQRAQSIQIASTSGNDESNTSSSEMVDSGLKQDTLALEPSSADPPSDQKDATHTDFSVVYDYWKNFDIKKLQDDLNNQIEKMSKCFQDSDQISSCFVDINLKLASLLEEDAFKTVSPIVELLRTEIDSLSSRTRANEITCTHLFKLLANVPDPFPFLEQVKSNKNNKQINRLQLENKTLKDKIQLLEKELTRVRNAEADNKEKELILSLSEQITNTMAINIDLTSKLKITEGELDSYKKLLSDYKSQLSEMKCKQINEIKSEIMKENDKLKLNPTFDLNSNLKPPKRSRSPSLCNGSSTYTTATATATTTTSTAGPASLKSLLDVSKEAVGKSSSSSCSSSSYSISSEGKHVKTEADNLNEYDSSNETDNDENVLNTCNLSPGSSAYEPLNTAEVAQKVRDLLSAHNIGQRVFAKCILGLSQGTVSELLSKPKHWDKLTEKGRESYRKMFNWSTNANSINSLKAISPKKGTNKEPTGYLLANSAHKEDSATLERIAQILYDAQKKIKSETFSSPMSPSSSNSESSPLMSPVCDQKSGEHESPDDDNETALDLSIKHGKKRKLNSNEASSDDDDASSHTNELESGSNKRSSALNSQLGLSPLNQFTPLLSSQFGKKITSFLNQNQANNLFMQQMMPAQSSFSRATSTPSPSPSLNTSTHSSFSNKPLKCVLPPVSQEQFDKYSQINTDELVKRVKDLLSKFSISQRLFGECILGLSQGSVSDLLARPKPWVMLTQKGREPFIRMQMFIDDPDSIKKLMASQYKTAGAAIDKVRSADPAPIFTAAAAAAATNIGPSGRSTSLSNIQNVLVAKESSNDSETAKLGHAHAHAAQINIIPYDIAALSGVGELNTDEITNRVKETLMNNNIGQKLFGEAVLNLSQGTVSELLSKPKPWNTLSIKGREPYLRMYMWLNDVLKLEKLAEWKEERNLQKKNSCAHEVETHDHQKPKRRFIFSEEQKDQLMRAFKYDPYPAVNQMEQLAAKLGLQTRTVINWFHNHRMRIRYKNNQNNSAHSAATAAAAAAAAATANSLSDISSLSNTLHSRATSFNAAGLSNLKFHGVLEQLNKMTDKTNLLNLFANVQSAAQHNSHEDGYEEDEDENQNESYQEYNEDNNEVDMQYNESFVDEYEDYEQQQNEQVYERNEDDEEEEDEDDDEHSVSLVASDLNRNKRRKPHKPQKLSNVNENLIKKTSCDVDHAAQTS